VISIGDDRVMAVTTDPFFVVPNYGWERAGWFAVHILASDITTSGLRPQYMTVDLNLPLSMTDEQLTDLWEQVDRTCKALELSIVTGHTGRYAGCNYPMVGGATMISFGDKTQYVSSGMSQAGDDVLLTKGVAIEATALDWIRFSGHLIMEEEGVSYGVEAG